jgi:hypothetical protein
MNKLSDDVSELFFGLFWTGVITVGLAVLYLILP